MAWADTIKDIKPIKNNHDVSGLDDAGKYIMATQVAKDTASVSGRDINDHQMEALIDSIYDDLGHDEKNTGRAARGQTGFRGFVDSLDSGMDYGIGRMGEATNWSFDNTIGNLVGTFNEDAGEKVKNAFDGKDAAQVLDTAATVGLALIPGVGIPLALGKTAINQSDNIADAFTGRENMTGENLSQDERAQKGWGAALDIGTSAIPGGGKIIAGRAANKALGMADNLIKDGAKLTGKEAAASGKALRKTMQDNAAKLVSAGKPGRTAGKVYSEAEKALFNSARNKEIQNGLKALAESGEAGAKKTAAWEARQTALDAQNKLRKVLRVPGREMLRSLTGQTRLLPGQSLGAATKKNLGNKLPQLAAGISYLGAPQAAMAANYQNQFDEDYRNQNGFAADLTDNTINRHVAGGMSALIAPMISGITRGKITPNTIQGALGASGGYAGQQEGEIMSNAIDGGMNAEEILRLLNEYEGE